MNVGFTVVVLLSFAVLLAGIELNDHLYVRGWPSTSLEAEPSNWTSVPVVTTWLDPALATGSERTLEMVTVARLLFAIPSFASN